MTQKAPPNICKRPRIEPRTVLLRAPAQLDTLKIWLGNLPLDEDDPVEVVIREHEVVIREQALSRVNAQNRLYWKRLGEIAVQAWMHRRQFSAVAWHIYCGRQVMSETITTKTGEVRSKWIETPDSVPMVISTTELEKTCFGEYITDVEVYAGVELGVMFSARPFS
jgi:hypothetical protein